MSTIENCKRLDTHKRKEFEALGEQLNKIYFNILERAQKAHDRFHFTENENENEKVCSLDNLLCYLALREQNLSELQIRLAEEGLASLAMSESNVLVSLERFSDILESSPINTSSLCKIDPESGRLLRLVRSRIDIWFDAKRKKDTHYGNT